MQNHCIPYKSEKKSGVCGGAGNNNNNNVLFFCKTYLILLKFDSKVSPNFWCISTITWMNESLLARRFEASHNIVSQGFFLKINVKDDDFEYHSIYKFYIIGKHKCIFILDQIKFHEKCLFYI